MAQLSGHWPALAFWRPAKTEVVRYTMQPNHLLRMKGVNGTKGKRRGTTKPPRED